MFPDRFKRKAFPVACKEETGVTAGPRIGASSETSPEFRAVLDGPDMARIQGAKGTDGPAGLSGIRKGAGGVNE